MSRILLAILLALASCSKSGPPHGSSDTDPVKSAKDPAAARASIASGAVVLDVRNPDEFAGGHLARATNLPVQEVTERIAEIDKLVGGDRTKPVVEYCAAGARAAKAKQQLEAAGYTHVVNGGGFDDLR